MAMICLLCGTGFSNALEVAVYRLCDYCEAKVPNQLVIRNPAAVPPENCADYDPIWRGEFNIWNKEYSLFGGLVAHLSLNACQKVSEEAKLFPLYLHFEMLPKSDLWPERFNMSEPSENDIALYFIPSEARFEQDFDHLVEKMIGAKLALQAFMPNAELLVFTSIELPLHHRRFQQKYYLWGVFRARRNSSSRQINHVK